MTYIKERIIELAKNKGVSVEDFAISIDMTYSSFKGNAKYTPLNSDAVVNILSKYADVNAEWLMTGKGEMLKDEAINKDEENKNLIPLYDDVATIGGTGSVANMDGVSIPSDYIDAGDWFKGATAAIRHYGDSMKEYPKGCILAVKEVMDKQLLIPGRDYVIETSEYRVTKQIQLGNDNSYLIAYSTNEETYSDGSLIHAPFKIPTNVILKMFLVLGYVVKTAGETIMFSSIQK